MSKQEPFVQLLDDLNKNYRVNFTIDPLHEKSGQLRALLNVRQQCVMLMQDHFDEIVELINFKRPCIEHLLKMTAEFDKQIDEINATLPPDRRREVDEKGESALPTTVEHSLPRR